MTAEIPPEPRKGPQGSVGFRIISFFARLQLRYLLRSIKHKRLVLLLFVITAGGSALGIITATAYLADLPLVFPPLGPTAFILFNTPMSDRASPRNVILSHSGGLFCGLAAVYLVEWLAPGGFLFSSTVLNWHRSASIVLAMGLIAVLMSTLGCVHPPAAASALIAAMGYLSSPIQVIGFIGAVFLLVLNAFLFNRIIGGLPYPVWRSDPRLIRAFGTLGGLPEAGVSYWNELASAMIHEHRRT